MTDYVLRVPSPNFMDCQRTSTAGDSTTQLDQWLWPPQALFHTPSQKRGMSWADEIYLRARAVNWAVRICITLQLPQLIIATAAAYIHRFYMRKPLQKYSPKVMSATALFLATKVEEVPRKLEYVVREYLKIDEDGNEQIGVMPEESTEFQILKQQILYYEDILLCTLCFDLAVDHPYVPLVNNVRAIHEAHSSARSPNPSVSVELADRSKAKSITQAAWGFINDSLMTPLCLFATPELIAAAAFLLAVAHRLSECPPLSEDNHSNDANDKINLDFYMNPPANAHSGNDHTPEPWWKVFRVESEEEIYQVANAMLDQYEDSVCGYIREKAATIARFPGPSLLCPPVQNVKTGASSQMNSEAPSPNLPSPRTTSQDVNNHGNFDVPTPEITGHEELRSQDVKIDSDKINPDVPLSKITEHEQLPPRDEESKENNSNKSPSQEELRSRKAEMAPKISYVMQSPIADGEEKIHPRDLRSHPGNSTPVRHAMSDNMDLGTSVGSNNSPSISTSPPEPDRLRQCQSTTPDKTPTIKKRTRSPGNSTSELHPPKTPKLEHTPKASTKTLVPLPSSTNFENPDPESLTEKNTQQNLNQVNQNISARDSETSLSDMEDGELDSN